MGANNVQSGRGDHHVRSQYEITRMPAGKSDRAKCIWCGVDKAWNIKQTQRAHLDKCVKYKAHMAKIGGVVQKTTMHNYFSYKDLSKEDLFALAIYTSTANFSMFETPEWEAFFDKLDFKPPSRFLLSTTLLIACYQRVKQAVQKVADAAQSIQIVADGSSSISKDCIENVSFLVDGISYYWSSLAIGTVSAGADWTVQNIIKAAKEITKGNLLRWTSFSSDTCSTQRKCWRLLNSIPGLQHIHSIPCDSHGLQLIFKDLLWPGKDGFKNQIYSPIGDFFTNGPNKIVSFFASSEKQLALLRTIQKNIHGKLRALIATVPTRWGTQVRQIQSVNANDVALKTYAANPDADCDKIKGTLQNREFWNNLDALERLLEPIHTFQKMSESNAATLDKVYPRWIQINEHMQEQRGAGAGPWGIAIDEYCNRAGPGGFDHRLNQQLLPVHIAAHVLMPHNHGVVLMPKYEAQLTTYLVAKAGVNAYEQFLEYRDKSNRFNPTKPCWTDFAAKPKVFWGSMKPAGNAPELAKLALELLNITANSVPSERAFSTMNLLQNKLRNRLTVENMDMLCFIYINSRSLRKAQGKKGWNWESELLAEMMDDVLLNMEDEIVHRSEVMEDEDEESVF